MTLMKMMGGSKLIPALSTKKLKELQLLANTIRKDIIIALANAKSGHSGGSLGMADIFTALYFHTLKHNPKKPNWQERDYLFLSNGHICPVLYATLAHAGYFKLSELSNLRKINSLLQGHPHNIIPGIENSSGPLAQGFSMAVGAALSLKTDKKANTIYALVGDGELDEGQIWEACMLAHKYQLNNFITIVDYNQIQLDGPTKNIMTLDHLTQRFASFGFKVLHMNGHDFPEIIKTLQKAKTKTKKNKTPTIIIAHTIPGKGVSFMERDYHWHGKPPKGKEVDTALNDLQKIEDKLLCGGKNA